MKESALENRVSFKIKDMKLASRDQRNNTVVKLLQIDIAKC